MDARESIQAEIRLKVKKILRKYGYLPDKEKKATEIVLKQAELIAKTGQINNLSEYKRKLIESNR